MSTVVELKAECGWDELAVPTADQWRHVFLGLDEVNQLGWAWRAVQNAAAVSRCVHLDHEGYRQQVAEIPQMLTQAQRIGYQRALDDLLAATEHKPIGNKAANADPEAQS